MQPHAGIPYEGPIARGARSRARRQRHRPAPPRVQRTPPAPLALVVLLLTTACLALLSAACTADETTTTSTAPTTSQSSTSAPDTSTPRGGASGTPEVPISPTEGEVVFSAPYGEGAGEFGFVPANESISDGPRAFWPLDTGDLYVLDPVNRRVQLVPSGSGNGGGDVKVIPIAEALAPRDLAVPADGTLVIDDSDGSATYQAYSPTGELRASVESAFGQVISVALAGDGTVVFAHMATGDSGRDLVYVPLYQDGGLLDPKDHLGAADKRVPLGGGWAAEAGTRSTEDAGGVPAGTLRVYETDRLWLETALDPRPLGGFVLQRTTSGRLIVCALAETGPGAGGGTADGSAMARPVRMVWLFDERGELVERTELPVEENLVDTFVTPVRATPDGAVYTLSTDADGLTIRRFQVE